MYVAYVLFYHYSFSTCENRSLECFQDCARDCGWNKWSEWSDCSSKRMCGVGTRSRTRTLKQTALAGSCDAMGHVEQEECFDLPDCGASSCFSVNALK